tara:strand:- start:874 stop:1602 length:729 start_codon:yes stop_codon:yes gene_type:complete
MLTSTILCVFEGAKREQDYFSSLQKEILGRNDIIKCSYGNDIFELFDEIKDDEDLNIVDVIRESKACPDNKILLNGLKAVDINQVYLFFDMECHDDKYNSQNLVSLVERFSLEDDFGKLFLSYPMTEALRDIPSVHDFNELTIDADKSKGKIYKRLSAERGLKKFSQIKKFTPSDWKILIKANVEKANYIVTSKVHVDSCCDQLAILNSQILKLEESHCIYVLSAFPIFAFYHIPKEHLNLL